MRVHCTRLYFLNFGPCEYNTSSKKNSNKVKIKVKKLSRTSDSRSEVKLLSRVQLSATGSSIHDIFQARILEWFAIAFSRGSSQSRDRTCTDRWTLPLSHQGSPSCVLNAHNSGMVKQILIICKIENFMLSLKNMFMKDSGHGKNLDYTVN